jgi:hypothetical protein
VPFQRSREELFTPVARESDAEEGIGNRWNHILVEDFIAACRKRAHNLIAASPGKYNPNLTN